MSIKSVKHELVLPLEWGKVWHCNGQGLIYYIMLTMTYLECVWISIRTCFNAVQRERNSVVPLGKTYVHVERTLNQSHT